MKSQFIALLPCIAFLVTFGCLTIIYGADSITHNNFAIFATFIALIVSTFTFQSDETFNERLEIFIEGSSKSIAAYICYIFFLSTIFTTILEETNCIASIANIILHLIPVQLILPGIFLAPSIFSFIAATSLGAIAIFMPIALAVSKILALDPSLVAATVVCGAISGENLCMLSHAIKTVNKTTVLNLFFNIKIIAIAFIGSISLLLYQNSLITNIVHLNNLPDINLIDTIKTIPLWLAFYLAFTKLDFLIIMTLGIICALSIGLYFNDINAIRAINVLFDGFYHSKDTVNIFILIFLLSGLSNIIIHNGGITYLINKLENKISDSSLTNFSKSCLITLFNICISSIIADQISKKRDRNYDISPKATFYIQDIQPFILQGILPHTTQLVLAASIANVSMISLLPCLYYQMILGAAILLGTIVYNNKPSQEQKK